MPSEDRTLELKEMVLDVADSFTDSPLIGVGNVYKEQSYLSASYLESLDAMNNNRKQEVNPENRVFTFDSDRTNRVFSALETGDKEEAINMLEEFIVQLEQENLSFLMLRYVFSDFLGSLARLSKKYNLELSKQTISLFIVAKDIPEFHTAAVIAMHEFCEKYEVMKKRQRAGSLQGIFEYINSHFMEYDLSIENVAEKMNCNTTTVRRAVQYHTGKTWRDYIIYLRIEYAKMLLQREDMSVAEICSQVGYGNISYFITLFKSMVGVTPAKYKKSIQNL